MNKTIYTIRFKGEIQDPLVDQIRKTARDHHWTGMNGFKQWAKENYNATLRSNVYNEWTSISFKTNQDMIKFKEDFNFYE